MFPDELIPLKIYSSNRKLIPINVKDKRKGSAIFLMSNNLGVSEDLMKLPYIVSDPYYSSYYLEKDLSFIIGENGRLLEKEEVIMNENYIRSKDDIYINFDEWQPKKGKNLLYVTGLSGSGKSTLAEEFETKYNAISFGLDWIINNRELTKRTRSDVQKNEPIGTLMIYDYFKKPENRGPDKLYGHEQLDFFNQHLEYLKKYIYDHPDTLFVIEGIQITDTIKPNKINVPMVIKNTSMIKSMYRNIRRDGPVPMNKNVNIIKMLKWYIHAEKELSKFKE